MNTDERMTHEIAAELLPWLANDSLPADEKGRVMAHARSCVVCRKDLEELQGHLYGLQAALEDVDGDFEHAKRAGLEFDYQEAYRWLYAGAQPLRSLWIEPRGT